MMKERLQIETFNFQTKNDKKIKKKLLWVFLCRKPSEGKGLGEERENVSSVYI